MFKWWLDFWFGADDREPALRHDAARIRERFGEHAEAAIDEAMASPALSSNRYEELAALKRALALIPTVRDSAS